MKLLNINIENIEQIFLDNKTRKKFIYKYKVVGQITQPIQLLTSFQLHFRIIHILISYEAATFRISETCSGLYNFYSYSQWELESEER
jgi:hypothetical protein